MNETWMKLLVQLRKRYNALNEAFDLTQQMDEALNRDDEVSFRMLLSMRQQVILSLQEMNQVLNDLLQQTSQEMFQRWKMLAQGQETQDPQELQVQRQMQQNGRLIDKLVEFDRRVNAKLARK